MLVGAAVLVPIILAYTMGLWVFGRSIRGLSLVVHRTGQPATPCGRKYQLGWFILIWALSVATLGVVER